MAPPRAGAGPAARARTRRAPRAPTRRSRPRPPARPTTVVARHALVAVDLDVHDHRPGSLARGLQARAHVVDRARPDHPRAERFGVGREVDRQRLGGPVVGRHRAVRARVVERAEAARADRARQRADRRVAVVLHEHDHELDPLGHRGRQLARQHQVRAVADHHEHLALGRGELDAHPARDLVAHARVAVLDVVALRVARPPQLVQVARHRAGRAHHHAGLAGGVVDRADHLGLARQRLVARRHEPRHLGRPRRGLLGRPRATTPDPRGGRPARPAAPPARAARRPPRPGRSAWPRRRPPR